MALNWRAIAAGIVVALILTLLSGFTFPFTDLALPGFSAFVIGLIAGGTTGYLAGGSLGNGALNGAVATAIGSLIGIIILSILGILVGGLLGLGIVFVGAILIIVEMIPGAIGGVIGNYLHRR